MPPRAAWAAARSVKRGCWREVSLAVAYAWRTSRYPVREPRIDPEAPVTLLERPGEPPSDSTTRLGREAVEVWRALSRSDAAVQVFRGAAGTLGIACIWSRLHRRRVVFAAASEADLTGQGFSGRADPRGMLFRMGMSMAHAVVVQTRDQVDLARAHFPNLCRLEQIDSFVDQAPEAEPEGEAFLWVSRLAESKRPLLYPRLAAEVPEARFWMIPSAPEASDGETLAELKRAAANLDNLEILEPRQHGELQELIGRAVAIVNTSSFEGMPNTWLEGWARGVPALTLSFDPDDRIAKHGLGISARGSWEAFVTGARELWTHRFDRARYGPSTRAYVADVHGSRVAERWAELLSTTGASR